MLFESECVVVRESSDGADIVDDDVYIKEGGQCWAREVAVLNKTRPVGQAGGAERAPAGQAGRYSVVGAPSMVG